VSGRHGRGVPDGQDSSQTAADVEASAAATAIAGLRWRLRRQEILEHPKVLGELRKLEDQVADQLAQLDRPSGRHRATAGDETSQQISDADGIDLKPDPLKATTPTEFVEALRQYKLWSGDPSWRTMAKRAGQAVVHSTMYAAMNGDTLPKLDVVKAIIVGCGGGEDDLSSFASAWRRIASGRAGRARFMSAPVAAP
jgi:hypothetical protein